MPSKRNPEAARIEADYKSKQKRTGRTANDKIKSQLKSGESKRTLTDGLVSYDEPGYPGGRFRKTEHASSSAPEGNRAAKGKKTATAREKAKKPARAKRVY
jgi:hypothetical protein